MKINCFVKVLNKAIAEEINMTLKNECKGGFDLAVKLFSVTWITHGKK